MNFEDKIKNINDKSFVDRRINQLKYLIFDSLGLPKENISIEIIPRLQFSEKSKRVTDIWNIEFYIKIETEVDPILSDLAKFFNDFENRLNKVFRNIGINQFLDIIKNPDRDLYNAGIFVDNIEMDGSNITIDITIDYETIAVEGADDL